MGLSGVEWRGVELGWTRWIDGVIHGVLPKRKSITNRHNIQHTRLLVQYVYQIVLFERSEFRINILYYYYCGPINIYIIDLRVAAKSTAGDGRTDERRQAGRQAGGTTGMVLLLSIYYYSIRLRSSNILI